MMKCLSIKQALSIYLVLAIGVVCQTAHAHAYAVLHRFGDGGVPSDGQSPHAGLIRCQDGDFYGTTVGGGAGSNGGQGTVFKMTPYGQVTIVHSFADGSVVNDGSAPEAPVIQGRDGNFYGTTFAGGSEGFGTVFKMTPAGAVTVLHNFYDPSIPYDGYYLQAGLVQGDNGFLYGTTYTGGSGESGTIFKIKPDGTGYAIIHSFAYGNLRDGQYPTSGLIQGRDGDFYGTIEGGSTGQGIVYKINRSGTNYVILHTFGSGNPTNDGAGPSGSLIQGYDGAFYGTTGSGGTNGVGAVYKITRKGVVTVLHSFTNNVQGDDLYAPQSSLLLSSDGTLYGTTAEDVVNGAAGGVYEIAPDGSGYTVLHVFNDYKIPDDGEAPVGSLVEGRDSAIFGTTRNGGISRYGTVYKIKVRPPVMLPTSF